MNNIRQVSQSVAECYYHTDLCISKITVSLSKNLYSIETFVINFFWKLFFDLLQHYLPFFRWYFISTYLTFVVLWYEIFVVWYEICSSILHWFKLVLLLSIAYFIFYSCFRWQKFCCYCLVFCLVLSLFYFFSAKYHSSVYEVDIWKYIK